VAPRHPGVVALTLLALALALTAASSAVPGTRLEVQDWDCPPAPASCARPVRVAGFPLPYISDYHGISPVGSTSLTGALLGEDHFHPGAFAANVAVYLALAAAAWTGIRRRTRRL
jgi:hypothetical protein